MRYEIDNNKNLQNVLKNVVDGDTLFFRNGIYKIKMKLTANNITIEGESKNAVITNDDFFTKRYSDYNETNTFRTYTLMITGENVTLKNITIQNSCMDSRKYGQAVALHVLGNNFKCLNCDIIGGQDTLFAGPLPENLQERYKNFLMDDELTNNRSKQYYKECNITGDVDYIFGCGDCLFDSCTIISTGNGYVSAPSHEKYQTIGFVFFNCSFINKTNGTDNTFLARPWRDYGMAYFINPKLDTHISSKGFNKWNGTNRDKTCRFYLYNPSKMPENLEYFAKTFSSNEEKENFMSNVFDYFK